MPFPLAAHGFAELWHPGVLAGVLAVQACYLLAVGPLRRRLFGDAPPASRAQVLAFLTGTAAVYASEGTPLHVMAERYLFSAHMLQHVLLTMVLPPLVLAGTPPWLLDPAVRPLRPLLAPLAAPVPAFLLFNGVYAAWHLPALQGLALRQHGLHLAQHATMVATALLMWMPLLSPTPLLPRLREPGQLLYICLLVTIQMVLFGPITFADRVLYPWYADAPRLWGLDPITDQQLSSLVMNVGDTVVLGIMLCVAFHRWASREAGGPRAERPRAGESGLAAAPRPIRERVRAG